MYNLTGLETASTVSDIYVFANQTTNNLLATLFIFSFFIVMLMSMRKYDLDDALLVASWSSFILCLLFMAVNLINFYITTFFLAIGAFVMFYQITLKRL
jgi:hypothetical protein